VSNMTRLSPLDLNVGYQLWDFVNSWFKNPQGQPHDFEDRVSEILLKTGYITFVRRRVHGKSCVNHEYDIITKKKNDDTFLFIECKTGINLLGKNEVLSLYARAYDVFNLSGKVLEVTRANRTFKYPFKDVYCVLISSIPLEKPALICALAFGILVIQPYCKFENYISIPPVHVDYFRLIRSNRCIDQGFRQEVEKLCKLTFRGLLEGQGKIFNGQYLYSILEKYHKIITTLL